MAEAQTSRLTVEEFLSWAEDRPGRYELFDGTVVAMAPERVRHAEAKFAVQTALVRALRQANVDCRMLPDGITVRVDAHSAFEPDALVYCGQRLAPDAVVADAPLIVVEVLSPGTGAQDFGARLVGYFKVASIVHYLIIDAAKRFVIHHRRTHGEAIETRILRDGSLRLEPPGIELGVEELFGEP
jgi:Uma2 family endonuclease